MNEENIEEKKLPRWQAALFFLFSAVSVVSLVLVLLVAVLLLIFDNPAKQYAKELVAESGTVADSEVQDKDVGTAVGEQDNTFGIVSFDLPDGVTTQQADNGFRSSLVFYSEDGEYVYSILHDYAVEFETGQALSFEEWADLTDTELTSEQILIAGRAFTLGVPQDGNQTAYLYVGVSDRNAFVIILPVIDEENSVAREIQESLRFDVKMLSQTIKDKAVLDGEEDRVAFVHRGVTVILDKMQRPSQIFVGKPLTREEIYSQSFQYSVVFENRPECSGAVILNRFVVPLDGKIGSFDHAILTTFRQIEGRVKEAFDRLFTEKRLVDECGAVDMSVASDEDIDELLSVYRDVYKVEDVRIMNQVAQELQLYASIVE